ncbi:MFS transporter [Agaribacter marinus]|uniref:MFS transporter n=1 Tax=Agaribacter marinus TaxID=1431249 RepID=A0AA37WMB2_9ALTE|nr:MFS transporter [Agaribacter marinus]GLR72635.1 MFS transporter [Agaribacter marinus]
MNLGFTVWGLALGQALLITGNILLVSVTAIIGLIIAPSPELSTLPVALQFIGLMLITLPAALLVKRWGRKGVFLFGNLIGVFGALIAYLALKNEHFVLFCISTLLLGFAIGIAQQYRFAAVENCSADKSSQAISLIMAGGIVAAVLGPNLAIWSEFFITDVQYLGAFAALIGLYVLTTILIALLPLKKASFDEVGKGGRSYSSLLKQPTLFSAIVAGVTGNGVMVLVMTATPLAMGSCGFDFSSTATVIQWHVLGMFAPSFVTGRLIAKYGNTSVMQFGYLLLLSCILLNQFGQSYWHFFSALVLLGVGWNFTFIAATNMLTSTYRPAEKAKVQGINDFFVFSGAALASVFAGLLLSLFSWQVLNLIMIPFVLFAVIAVYISSKQSALESISER